MTELNSQQLAFLLDIKKEDARARMCNAYSKAHDVLNTAERVKNKIVDSFPKTMPIDMPAKGLNLPTLQKMVDDIRENYLKRQATKKYILYDYPEAMIKKAESGDKPPPYKVSIPPALASLLTDEDNNTILNAWESKYKNIRV